MRVVRVALLFAMAPFVACANLLSYDDYQPRPTLDAQPDVTIEAATDGGEEAETSPSDPGAHPPGRPEGAIAPSGKGKTLWLVVNHFYLNQEDISTGVVSSTAWRTIGYDVDHVCTSVDDAKANIGTCIRAAKAPQDVLTDGDGCRDNNFGSQIVPLVNLVDGSYEKTSNNAVANGVNTWLLKLEDLDDGPDDPYVKGYLYKAARWSNFGVTQPAFDGSDVRQIESESVIDDDPSRPKTLFTQGYLANNVFVSGEPGAFQVSLPIQGVSVVMPLIGGTFVVRLDAAHTIGVLGAIAGGIPGDKTADVLAPIADQAGVCPGDPLYDGLIASIGKSFDLVAGAKNLQDSSKPCDTLSIGLGFTMVPVQPAFEVVPTPTPVRRCSMASDGGAG